MRFILLLIAVLLFSGKPVIAQISEGGKPIEVLLLKSNGIPVEEMPRINNEELKMQAGQEQEFELRLKPVVFAHAFDVHFSTANSGIWLSAGNETVVWKLKIHSEGAKSLNLIFDNFNLPPGARLFLYNENENHLLGAFTWRNNKPSGKFAVSPVAGDEITIQYEVPEKFQKEPGFIITQVNHDFLGILKYDERRPLNKTAGFCNIDVNCEIGDEWKEVKDAVCRLIVNGKEICTGTLINNTAEDDKPYIISAAHCYDDWSYAETTVYTFNYESPYCAPLDGDPSQSVSGAVMKAQFDSLDFALAELSLIPPPEYHPYYAGWDRTGTPPDSSTSIHHPQGDIKKFAYDGDPAVFSDFNSNYTKNGFIKILRWEGGVTENGSSGGPLFNPDQNLIGTLTGGVATCSNPVKDYFSRFDMAWDFKSDSTKQLKHWLDPVKSGVRKLEGKRIYSEENVCATITNLDESDFHFNVPITNFGDFEGYWGGTNKSGITEITERFSIPGSENIAGISFGVGKILDLPDTPDSEIKIKIYNGGKIPEYLIYSQPVKIKSLAEDAMNFIALSETVQPADTFFVGYELSNIQPADTFVIYQSLRSSEKQNNFFFKQDGLWQNFRNANLENYSMTNVIELLACNVNGMTIDSQLVDSAATEMLIYPNPVKSYFTLKTKQKLSAAKIDVFNLIGQKVDVKFSDLQDKKVIIDLTGNVPGVYFVRFKSESGYITRKISFVPW